MRFFEIKAPNNIVVLLLALRDFCETIFFTIFIIHYTNDWIVVIRPLDFDLHQKWIQKYPIFLFFFSIKKLGISLSICFKISSTESKFLLLLFRFCNEISSSSKFSNKIDFQFPSQGQFLCSFVLWKHVYCSLHNIADMHHDSYHIVWNGHYFCVFHTIF